MFHNQASSRALRIPENTAPPHLQILPKIGADDHALGFQKRIESGGLPLVSKFLATLELKYDKVRIVGNIFRKMYITVAAAECACRDGGGFGRSIRKSEVEGLIGKENGTTCGMPVHDRFGPCTVADSKNTYQLVLE